MMNFLCIDLRKILVIFFVFLSFQYRLFAKDSPFGVLTFLPWNESHNNYMYDSEEKVSRAITLLKELGVSIIRVDFSWPQIEPVRGEYELARIEYILKECEKNDIEVLGVLGYSAPWTQSKWNEPPQDVKLFADYCARMAEKYKQVKYWEIWNEPDSATYWKPQDDDMAAYFVLLKEAYGAIKKINPQAKVLIGGLTDDGLYKFKRLLGLGGGEYFDILNLHPFVDALNPRSVERMKGLIDNFYKALRNAGYDKKVWVTEIGCPGKNESNATWWNGRSPDEAEQADFLKRVYGYALHDTRIEKIFWAFFQDTPAHFHDAVDDFGLIRADFSKKPAFNVYQQIIKENR